MSKPTVNPILRFLPSLTDVAFLMPFVYVMLKLKGAPQLLEGDTGWHIRAGEWMLANGRIMREDHFSFTRPGEPWFAWEWLWDVAFAWIHQRMGLEGVVLVSLLVISCSFAWLYRLSARVSGNVLVAGAVTLLALAGSVIHWWARPHVFTFLFLVGFLDALERARSGDKRWLWALPVATAVWVNIHGGFLAGILVILAFAGEHALRWVIHPASRGLAQREFLTYAGTAAACLVASLANPFSYHLHLHIFGFLNRDGNVHTLISEWQSMNFQGPAAIYFELMVLLGMASAVWHAQKGRFAYVFLIAGWLHLGLLMARNVPLFLIVAAPAVALALTEILEMVASLDIAAWIRSALAEFREIAGEMGQTEKISRVPLFTCIAVSLVAWAMGQPSPNGVFAAKYDRKDYPVDFLQRTPATQLTGNIFTSDEWGDYVIYRLNPRSRVYMDGRFDFYGRKHTDKYLGVLGAKHDWKKHLAEFGITKVLLPVDCPLSSALKESAHWRSVYDDGIAIYFEAADQRVPLSVAAMEVPVPSAPRAQ
jgi:hypothetical protein